MSLIIFYRQSNDLLLLQQQLQTIESLYELVCLRPLPEGPLPGGALYADGQRLYLLPDWLETRPAVVFPSDLSWNKEILLGCIYGLLGNMPACQHWLHAYPHLTRCFALLHALSNAEPMEGLMEQLLKATDFEHPFHEYAFNHNVALACQHGYFEVQVRAEVIECYYSNALRLASDPSLKALTLHQYLTFLLDQGREQDARAAMATYAPRVLQPYPRHLLQQVTCRLQLQLYMPGIPVWDTLKEHLWDSLHFYEQYGHQLPEAQLLLLATEVVSKEGRYAEAQGYVLKAIALLQQLQHSKLLAEARLLQARILFDWGQQGYPQFIWQSLYLLQQVMQVFNEQDTPLIFADIQHQMGIVYAALPDDPHKRILWTSLSATAFGHALRLYTPEHFPKQHALVCQNYGRSLLLLPSVVPGDHALQALGYLQRALSLLLEHDPSRPSVLLDALEATCLAGIPTYQNSLSSQPCRHTLLQEYTMQLAAYPKWRDEAHQFLRLLSQQSNTSVPDTMHNHVGVSR